MRDAVLEISKQAAEMCLERFGDPFDRRQFAVHDAAIPLFEEGLAGIRVGLVPELHHLLFVGPSLGGALVGFEQVGGSAPFYPRGFERAATERGSV